MAESEELDSAARDFLRAVSELYLHAQKAKFRNVNSKPVYRSRSKSVSSDAEDLLADHLAVLLIEAKEIWVDVALTSIRPTAAKRLMPDVVVLGNDEQIVAVIDLKMDMGWNRQGETALLERFNQWMSSAKKRGAKSGWGDKIFKIDPKAKYHIAVVTEHNSGDMSNIERDLEHASLWTFAGPHWHPNATVSAQKLGQGHDTWSVEDKMVELEPLRPDFGLMVQGVRDVLRTDPNV
jgi:hypothetical protein